MRRIGTLFLVALALLAFTACSGDDSSYAEQTVEIEVNYSVPTTRALLDSRSQTEVGTVTVCNQSGLMHVDVHANTGYRLMNLRACVAPNLQQAECQPWISPQRCGRDWRSFTFHPDELQPQQCSVAHRVYLRYVVIQTEMLH